MGSQPQTATVYGSGPMPRACSRSAIPSWWSTRTIRQVSHWKGTVHSINRRDAINAENKDTSGEGWEKVNSEGREGRKEEGARASFAFFSLPALDPDLVSHRTNLRFGAT